MIRKVIRARIQATAIDPRLNILLSRELPDHITRTQANDLHDQFLERSTAELARHGHRLRRPDVTLMAEW